MAGDSLPDLSVDSEKHGLSMPFCRLVLVAVAAFGLQLTPAPAGQGGAEVIYEGAVHLSLRAGPAHRNLTECSPPREDTGWSAGDTSSRRLDEHGPMHRHVRTGGVERMNAGLSAVSWLDWKLGARLLLKYPALTIIGGLSLAGAIAIGAVGIEVADELLYKRLPFDEGGRVVRLETQDTVASRVEPRVLHDFAIWRRSLKTVAELGAARVSERNVLTGERRVESLRVAEITASAFPLTRVPPLLGRALQRRTKCRVRNPSWSWVTTSGRDSSCTTRRSLAAS